MNPAAKEITEGATPFAVVAASVSLADWNQVAALVLTLLGIVYTGRKLWLSFQKKNRRTAAE